MDYILWVILILSIVIGCNKDYRKKAKNFFGEKWYRFIQIGYFILVLLVFMHSIRQLFFP